MVNTLRRFAVIAGLLSLASPSPAQMRTSLPVAPVGGISAPLTPFTQFAAPALSFSPSLTAPSLSPALMPSAAPALAAALPVSVEQGRSFFDGAAAKPDMRPASLTPARAPRGETVALNDIALPARMFSDQTSIAGELIRAIDASRVSIDIAIHGLALREVAAALVRAKNRGVKVRVVMNQTHVFPEKQRATRSAEVQLLMDQGFEMKMLRGGDMFGIMHNKIAIFDEQVLETGSYNWTHAADVWHWENAMFHADQARIKAYQAYWDWMWSISLNIPSQAPALPTPIPEGEPHPGLPPAPQDDARPVQFNGEAFPAQAFSPGGVTAHLVRAIDAAKASIDLANFSFTSEELRDALLRAKERGVKVRIVFDADQYKFLSEMRWFADNGFDLLLSRGKDGDKGVMHNKFAVFDGALVEAGSFNWTRNGEKNNYENAIFLDAPDDVAGYAAYFSRIRAQAKAPEPGDHAGPHAAPADFHLRH
ncbi:MAG: phospholipase D-like domain-containing protein [Elusimicrobia bacterium]|nr:phospholipase D-like domain-containing protein [Elusimicrobiota bacterium]